MSRYTKSLKLLSAVALLGGCAGEETTVQELIPETVAKLSPAPREQLVGTVKQQIASMGYSTYLGFGGDEFGNALAVDGSGNTYVTGTTTTFGGTLNVFVAKMSPSGTNIYYTYFPGTQSQSIAVDGSGNTYVVYTSPSGPALAKINATGTSMLYLANIGWNELSAVKVDSAGHAYVVGSINNGVSGVDVAVGKVDPTGSYFVYAQAFGGTGIDKGNGIAIDTAGNAYIVGTTASSNFPVVSAFQTTLRGPEDAFITKLNSTGSGILFSTYLGGNTYDTGTSIALDGSNYVYVTGSTAALNGVQSFPVTSGTVQYSPGGGGDAYAAKFTSTGSRIYATYIGGGAVESGASIAVSRTGVAYVTGYTTSGNFPTTSLAYQRFPQSGADAFVVQLSTNFGSYSYSTYLGGSSTDMGSSIAVDGSGHVYVTGRTNSVNFPTTVYAAGGLYDAFVTKFNGP